MVLTTGEWSHASVTIQVLYTISVLSSALSAQIGNVLKLEESQGPAFAECSAVKNQNFH